jgi:hypothetical protein
LLLKGLSSCVQLLKAGPAITMNHSDGDVAIARKMTPLVWPIERRIRRLGRWRRFSV